MRKLKCGVIGVGHLGKYHAQKYTVLENVELIAISDTDPVVGKAVSSENRCLFYDDFRMMLDKVDAVSVVVPTSYHFDVSKVCLEHGVHVLVEKPITSTVEEAEQLITLAKKNDLKLQVGHIERYNPAIIALEGILKSPWLIQSNRLAPFKPRIKDANVVSDLMIHDIEIIQYLVNSPIKSLQAVGSKVLSNKIDVASARLEFENGCIANVMASRVSNTSERINTIFDQDHYVIVDMHNKNISICKKDSNKKTDMSSITVHQKVFDDSDALLEEIKDFVGCIQKNKKPKVDGISGRNALSVSVDITRMIKNA